MKHDLARTLRRSQTDLERRLWYILRGRRFHTHKFRRQQPIGPYIVDFVCFERRLVVELDGSQHAAPENVADRARTAFLESQGFRVLRFWNLDFIQNRDGVLWRIDLALEERFSSRPRDPSPAPGQAGAPLPQGEREIARQRRNTADSTLPSPQGEQGPNSGNCTVRPFIPSSLMGEGGAKRLVRDQNLLPLWEKVPSEADEG